MCFSPEADLVAGVVISAIGIDTLRRVEHPNERPIASLPLIFGTHQLVEAVVWWGVDGHGSDVMAQWSAWLYLAVAFGLLPWFVPWAVRRIEPRPRRRTMMGALAAVGGLVSGYLMWAVVRGPVEVIDGGYHLDYSVSMAYGGLVVGLYVLVTCGSLLLSSDRYVVLFGVINLAAIVTLSVLLLSGVISLWCLWAAATSAALVVHLRRTDRHRHRFVDSDVAADAL